MISDGSVRKDTIELREAYAEAGIPEYWLVDARGDDILRLTAKGYATARKSDGGIKSSVFRKSFRLLQSVNILGNPTLQVGVSLSRRHVYKC